MLKEGDRVVVCRWSNYRGKYTDKTGIVERRSGNRLGVRLDGYTNSSSGYGLFWFEAEQLKIQEQESEDYFMDKNYITAGVRFLDGSNTNSTYYYALYDTSCAVDDLVVVKTGHHGLALAKIVSIDPNNLMTVSHGREIISKVDLTAYNARKERAKKLAELKKQMDEKVKRLQELALYEMLSKEDSELAEMLTEYKALSDNEEGKA